MKNLIKQAHSIAPAVATSAAYAGVLMALFLFVGISTAQAATTYVVDTSTSDGSCGSFCQQLQAYLSGQTQTSNVNGGSNVSSDNGNYVPTDSPFFSAVAPANGSNGSTGSNAYGSNGYNGSQYGASNTGYTPYPYLVYNYYQNPNPSGQTSGQTAYAPATSGVPYTNYGSAGYGSSGYGTYNGSSASSASAYTPYPNLMYVPYGQNGSTNVGSYGQTSYGQTSAPYAAGTTGSGFIRTSGY